jgi:predicted unusual protein kinase regulating ubiquinone biosynthesis (AarF/ABC1/UbiB family)
MYHRQLQDAVPQFDSKDAFEIIKREMGIKNDIREKFLSITTLPVASASIGQGIF